MSVYGYFTNRDLTKIGSFLFMALIGLIIASVINLFWANSTLEWIVSIAGVIIFVGLTAWDNMAADSPNHALPPSEPFRSILISSTCSCICSASSAAAATDHDCSNLQYQSLRSPVRAFSLHFFAALRRIYEPNTCTYQKNSVPLPNQKPRWRNR